MVVILYFNKDRVQKFSYKMLLNVKRVWRPLSRKHNTIIITLLMIVLYVGLLQIIVNVLFRVFNPNSESESISGLPYPQKRQKVVEQDKFIAQHNTHKKIHHNDNNENLDEVEEPDMLNYNDDYSNDIRVINHHDDVRLANVEDDENPISSQHLPWSTHDAIIERTKDCAKYFDVFPVLYFNQILQKYEKQNLKLTHSLAFSHLVHKEIAIYEAFLSVYFRPNDFYCIHVDKEAKTKVWRAVEGLVKCYSTKMNNGKIVLIDKKESYKVRWGQDQMLKADIKCIQKLLELRKRSKSPWSHSISMAGSELPLVTYASFKTTLSEALGKDDSSLESFVMPNYQLKRRLNKKAIKNCTVCPDDQNTETRKWNKQTPLEFSFVNPLNKAMTYKMQVYKGLRSVILSAKDAEFMVNHPVGKQFYQWIEKSSMTEEHFYSSLIRVKVDPKTSEITQDRDTTRNDMLHGLCIRYTHWYYGVRMGGKTYKRKACFGNFNHAICNFNLFDLEKLKEASEHCLIGNKFSLDIDTSAVIVHWSNLMSRSFEETGKFSKTMNEYAKGNERNFTKSFHNKIMTLVNWQ